VRESVVAAADGLLSEVGVVGFTTKAVAQRAGVAESSIFYHFGDRLGLLQEIIFAQVGGYTGMVDSLIEEDSADVEAGLRRLLDFLEQYYQRILPGMMALQADPQTLAAFRRRGQRFDVGPHRAVGPVEGYLRSQHRAGRLRADADLRSVAVFIVGSAFQRALLHRFGGPSQALPSTATLAAEISRTITGP
jgi:AcrR family transcriptional regulator